MTVTRDRDSGRAFDLRMANYLRELSMHAMNRRGLIKIAAGGAAAMTAALGGERWIMPGVSVLAQDASTLTFGLQGDVRGLEPALSYDFVANPVTCNISEPLLRFTLEGTLEPWLAESWEQPDELTYVYTLREGVKFSDGSPMTTDDVLASIARVRDPEVAGPLAWMYDVPGATAEKTDEKTITIKLAAPSALFGYVVATTAGHVIPAAAIAEFGPDLLRNPRGTGPYTLERWDAGSEIALVKNPNYWVAGKPHFDHFVFKFVEEGTTRVTGLKTGELNMATDVPPDQLETVASFENINLQEVVGYTINRVELRYDKPPFSDANVRKAVNHAVDIAAIIENIVGITGIQSRNTAVPPNMPGSASDELEPIPYDIDKAKELIAASATPDGFATQIHTSAPSDVWVPQAIAVQEALKALNIEVEIKQYTYADFITLQQEGSWEGMLITQWGSDFPDAAGNLIPLYLSRNVPPQNNYGFYSNPEVDKLLDASEVELDQEKRLEMLRQVQRIIAEDQPAIYLEHFKWFLPMSANLTGYTLAPLWYWDSFGRDLVPVTS